MRTFTVVAFDFYHNKWSSREFFDRVARIFLHTNTLFSGLSFVLNLWHNTFFYTYSRFFYVSMHHASRESKTGLLRRNSSVNINDTKIAGLYDLEHTIGKGHFAVNEFGFEKISPIVYRW